MLEYMVFQKQMILKQLLRLEEWNLSLEMLKGKLNLVKSYKKRLVILHRTCKLHNVLHITNYLQKMFL